MSIYVVPKFNQQFATLGPAIYMKQVLTNSTLQVISEGSEAKRIVRQARSGQSVHF